MIVMEIDPSQIKRLKAALGENANKLQSDIAVAINATGRKTRTLISKKVREELAVTAKGVNKSISLGTRANKARLRTSVTLKKTARISLKEFGARQTKKGTSYRISKRTGRKTVRSAFVSNRLGGHVYKRTGPNRLPITRLHGPSPWGVFKIQSLRLPTVKESRRELAKQLERRIRFRKLKASGAI